jgi:Membrane carboxypeptidase (penicillin-binding protein)
LVSAVGSTQDFTGFNRTMDAKRQVGSLLKPVIYLSAIESTVITGRVKSKTVLSAFKVMAKLGHRKTIVVVHMVSYQWSMPYQTRITSLRYA